MRTYSRSDWYAALQAWDDGEFSSEWKDVRHKAAMGGIIFPPSGTRWDSWEDDSPSQRAMLIRAIRETPKLLDRCITGAKSWGEVIDRLLSVRDDWRREQHAAEQAERDEFQPDERDAIRSLAQIMKRIEDAA